MCCRCQINCGAKMNVANQLTLQGMCLDCDQVNPSGHWIWSWKLYDINRIQVSMTGFETTGIHV